MAHCISVGGCCSVDLRSCLLSISVLECVLFVDRGFTCSDP